MKTFKSFLKFLFFGFYLPTTLTYWLAPYAQKMFDPNIPGEAEGFGLLFWFTVIFFSYYIVVFVFMANKSFSRRQESVSNSNEIPAQAGQNGGAPFERFLYIAKNAMFFFLVYMALMLIVSGFPFSFDIAGSFSAFFYIIFMCLCGYGFIKYKDTAWNYLVIKNPYYLFALTMLVVVCLFLFF